MKHLLIFISLVLTLSSIRAATIRDEFYNDESVEYGKSTTNFYDSLESKTTRRKIPELIYSWIFVGTPTRVKNSLDQTKRFEMFEGKTIDKITIERSEVFNTNTKNWFLKLGNKVHTVTSESRLRKDLFFESGDVLDPDQLVNNEQYLQGRSYIYRANIEADSSLIDPSKVDLVVSTRDSWSLSMALDYKHGGSSSIEIFDENIFGTGNKLSVITNVNFSDWTYGGNYFKYNMTNIRGTFIEADFIAGRNFDYSDLGFEFKKDFLQPQDYMFSFSLYDSKNPYYILSQDTTVSVKDVTINAQLGKSFYIPSMKSSFYMLANVINEKYNQRPEVSATLNPSFHNSTSAFLGVGLYKESFYATNLIYGYGLKEYIARGYRAELIGGYRNSEYFSDFYMGANLSVGNYVKAGYFRASFGLGSYFEPLSDQWRQSVASFEMQYFTNALSIKKSKMRQFVTLSYMRGWNRLEGSDEYIKISREDMRGLSFYNYGKHRLILNTENVVFTPFAPLGFRVAFFTYADLGLLGNNVNIFKNDYFTTFGIGLRIKNEHLIFSRIELRLGLSFSKNHWMNYDIFRASGNYELDKFRFIPDGVKTITYD